MPLFRSSTVVGIAADALRFALEASREIHPNEYMGLLRGEAARDLGLDRDGTVDLPDPGEFFGVTEEDLL